MAAAVACKERSGTLIHDIPVQLSIGILPTLYHSEITLQVPERAILRTDISLEASRAGFDHRGASTRSRHKKSCAEADQPLVVYVHVEKEAAKRGPVLSRTAAAWLVNTTAIDTIGPREWVAHADAIEAQLCQIENIQVWTEMGAKPGMLECSMIGRKPQLEAYQKALREYLNAVLNGERPSGNSSWKRAHKAPLPDLGSGEPLPRTRRAVHAAPTPTQIAAMNEVNHGYVRERIRDPSISPP